jgi:hypothetical protein
LSTTDISASMTKIPKIFIDRLRDELQREAVPSSSC